MLTTNRFILLLIISISLTKYSISQGGYTTVSGQVLDPAGNQYSNCTITASFVNNTGSGQLPLISGSTFQTQVNGISCDSSGNFSLRLADNNAITPLGTQWKFSICNNKGTTPCFTYTSPVCPTAGCITGSSINITSFLQAVAPSVAINGIPSLSGNNTFTGSNTFTQLGNIRWANASVAGADCGAKINTQDAALGAGTPGEIWVDQSCGLTISTAVVLGTKHTLRFVQGGTWTYSATITLGANGCMVGPPGAISDDSNTYPETSVILKQANSTNLANSILVPNSLSCMQDITLDGNRANNTSTGAGILVTGFHFHSFRNSITQFANDGIQITSTGSTNNAAEPFIEFTGISRNANNAVTCIGTADSRVFQSFLVFNGGYGWQNTNCNSPTILQNEISDNSNGGIYITGSSTNAILFSQHPSIIGNSFGLNLCAAGVSKGGDIAIQGWDGSSSNMGFETQIIGNRFVGGNATSNTCDAIHTEATADILITGNKIRSSIGNTWRYGINVLNGSGTAGRHIVTGNAFTGTFGTALHNDPNSVTDYGSNDEGATAFSEFDTALKFIPNSQSLQAKNPAATVFASFTPSNVNGDSIWNVGTATRSAYVEINGAIIAQFSPTQLIFAPLGYSFALPGATSGTSSVQAPATGGGIGTLPQGNGTFTYILTATSAAFATATTAGTCVQSTTAVANATTLMVATASPVSTPGVGAQWSAFVSSAGNVTINECAVAASAGGTIAFNIRVFP